MNQADATSYDDVPYPSIAFPQSHPDRLAAVATLFGMDPAPAPPASSRVLEIGCALGDNLIPLALQHPEAELLGIDLSPAQIAIARERASELGLSNLRFEAIDVFEFPSDLGPFDYILCHGVYSWVPEGVRRAILDVVHRHLRPAGVAYVSYNTNPGWRMKTAIRDILLYDTRNIAEPDARIDRAEGMLAFLEKAVPEMLPLHRIAAMAIEKNTAREIQRAHIFHEFLEEVNDGFYFREFVDQAAQHDLQFLGEADISEMHAHFLPAEAARMLAQLEHDPIEREQYLDFVKGRAFRQSLLCHAGVAIDRTLDPARLSGLQLSSGRLTTEESPTLSAGTPLAFRDDRGRQIATDNPFCKAALLCLSDLHPRALALDELERVAAERTSTTAVTGGDRMTHESGRAELRSELLQLVTAGFLEVHAAPPVPFTDVSERPTASPWSRMQAVTGAVVTNLRHRAVDVDDFRRHLLTLLDGTRTHEQILADLTQAVCDSELAITALGAAPISEDEARATLAPALPQELAAAARTAFLIG